MAVLIVRTGQTAFFLFTHEVWFDALDAICKATFYSSLSRGLCSLLFWWHQVCFGKLAGHVLVELVLVVAVDPATTVIRLVSCFDRRSLSASLNTRSSLLPIRVLGFVIAISDASEVFAILT